MTGMLPNVLLILLLNIQIDKQGARMSFFKFKNKLKKEKASDVGIISYNINTGAYNFGAALHSYAFQKYLDKKNIDNIIVNYYSEGTRRNFIYKRIINNVKKKNYKQLLPNIIRAYFITIKKIKFENFFRKNCNVTKNRYTIKTLPQLKKIGRFVCETDVTWCKTKYGFDKGFLCDLPNMKKKNNVAYSIDFGSTLKSEEDKKRIKKYAKNFKYISIRNAFKLEYFKEITGRNDAIIIIDPVFLLDGEDYAPIIKPSGKSREYLLVYNCKENNQDMINCAKICADKNNLQLKIINCHMDMSCNKIESFPTPLGIEEFLGYIKNAKYLYTNSFHGICFAIIFNIPFYAFARTGNNEKILTLLEHFNLYDRMYSDENLIYPPPPTDLRKSKEIRQRLVHLRDISEQFLNESIISSKEGV